ncbi:MAG: RNA 2',3'-cyclic phosphodiesterase [bacterium]
MSLIRTFIAIEISEDVRKRIAEVQEDLKKSGERISWTRPENVHLTLKFLGEVEEKVILNIADVLTTLGQEWRAFSFKVAGLGVFPNVNRPRVIWAGIENVHEEFAKLVSRLEEGMSQLGFKKEPRSFTPHLTIGRVKSVVNKTFVDKIIKYQFEGGETHAQEIVVMRSDLLPSGALYTPLRKIKLAYNE